MEIRKSVYPQTGRFLYLTVNATLDEIKSLFGEPDYVSDELDKSQYEWDLELFGLDANGFNDVLGRFYLYDWCEEHPIGDDEIIGWHIGGSDKYTGEQAKKVIERMLKR